MLSLEIYRYLTHFVRSRPDVFLLPSPDVPCRVKTFSDSHSRVHVVFGHEESRSILANKNFLQPGISAAIDVVMGGTGHKCLINDKFLRPNPINRDGSCHKSTRTKYIRNYGKALSAIKSDIPEHAQRSIEHLTSSRSSASTLRAVSDYVDDVLALLLSTYDVTDMPRDRGDFGASDIFEYFHSRTKLSLVEEKVCKFVTSVSERNSAFNQGDLSIVLSYLLQGREPLVGALSDYLNWLTTQNEQDRQEHVQNVRARDLFWQTSPVNYIGRVAKADTVVGETRFHRGDQAVIMLSWARSPPDSQKSPSLAFGAGAHICAGQAISLEIADHWLSALRCKMDRINWPSMAQLKPASGVFRTYRE